MSRLSGDEIRDMIKKELRPFIGKVNVPEVVESVRHLVNSMVARTVRKNHHNHHVDELKYVDFDVTCHDGDTIHIKPHNLFTFLLMTGNYVPYSTVGDKTEIELDFATYGIKNDELYVIPKRVPQYIDIDISLN